MVRYLFYTIGDLTYQSPLVTRFQGAQKSSNSEPLIERSSEMKATAFYFEMTSWFDTENLLCFLFSMFYILWHYVQRVVCRVA